MQFLPSHRSLVAALALASLCGACINSSSDRGVEPRWHEVEPGSFERGVTTRSEVLDRLGPPSQILSLERETALYYMVEKTRMKGKILVVYNDRDERTTYDRAVFFFDEQDVLTDWSATEAPR